MKYQSLVHARNFELCNVSDELTMNALWGTLCD